MTNGISGKGTTGGLERSAGGLQGKVLAGSDLMDGGALQSILWHSRHICRVDIETRGKATGNGTGFLVGPDLVLTNYHVIENVAAHHIECRFDYRTKGAADFESGPVVDVVKIVRTSPYSQAEYRGEYSSNSTEHPGADELDYALLRLARKVGAETYRTRDGDSTRGWIALSLERPSARSASEIYILQHPNAEPISISRGPLCGAQPTDTRVRYKATSLGGSSGSPCFQLANEEKAQPVLVALHNYGDPGWQPTLSERKPPEFNHGIPIEQVARDIRDGGIELPPAAPTGPAWPLLGLSELLRNNAFLTFAFVGTSLIQFFAYNSHVNAIDSLMVGGVASLLAVIYVSLIASFGAPILLLTALREQLSGVGWLILPCSLINVTVMILWVRKFISWMRH